MAVPITWKDYEEACIEVLQTTSRANQKWSLAEETFLLQALCIKEIPQDELAEFLKRGVSGIADKMQALRSRNDNFTNPNVQQYIAEQRRNFDQDNHQQFEAFSKNAVSLDRIMYTNTT
jgi:hypothetical protein